MLFDDFIVLVEIYDTVHSSEVWFLLDEFGIKKRILGVMTLIY